MIYGINGTDPDWATSMGYNDNGGFTGAINLLNGLVLDIFKLVNPNLSAEDIKVTHDWTFQGLQVAEATTEEQYFLNDITFLELSNLAYYYFYDSSQGLSTVGDALKKIAIDLCSFTGMISKNKPFFKKLFHYDSNNTQSMIVLTQEKNYKYGLLDYINIKAIPGVSSPFTRGTFTNLKDRYYETTPLSGFTMESVGIAPFYNGTLYANVNRTGYFRFACSAPITTFPNIGYTFTNNGSVFEVTGKPYLAVSSYDYIIMKRITGTNDPSASGTLVGYSQNIVYSSVGDINAMYEIIQGWDPNLLSGAWSDSGDLLAEFWWNFRGNIQRCRVDKFKLLGCNYDFLKDFLYGTSKYQIISLTLYPSQNYSECEAIYIG